MRVFQGHCLGRSAMLFARYRMHDKEQGDFPQSCSQWFDERRSETSLLRSCAPSTLRRAECESHARVARPLYGHDRQQATISRRRSLPRKRTNGVIGSRLTPTTPAHLSQEVFRQQRADAKFDKRIQGSTAGLRWKSRASDTSAVVVDDKNIKCSSITGSAWKAAHRGEIQRHLRTAC